MKKLILYTVLFFSAVCGYAQINLVPNPSFELYNACPDTFITPNTGGNIEASQYWFNAGGFTPDYFNPCDTNITYPSYGVPLNQYGFQNARTGSSYAGIILSYLYGSTDSVREYISARMIDSLVQGKSYEVKFFVSLSDSCVYAANDIGAFLSDTIIPMPSYPYPLPYLPQIQNNPSINPLIDMNGWIEVRDTFIANGGEKYITIGNFKGDSQTDTTNLSVGSMVGSPWAYYYIDDVSVLCLDCSVGVKESFQENKLVVYPNPAQESIKVRTNGVRIKSISISNFLGENLLELVDLPDNEIHIPLIDLQNGVYLMTITDVHGQVHIKRIIKN